MYKIRLLILSLISIIFFSCSNKEFNSTFKFSVGYIEGEYDGLLLSNQLKSYLSNLNLLDQNSKYNIQANISHSNNVYITNIDNTSEREKVSTQINISIIDLNLNCKVYNYNDRTSQFYILTVGEKFISNRSALEEIKFRNTEYFVKKFLNRLPTTNLNCQENE